MAGKKIINWLKIFHLIFICAWIGGGAAAVVLTATTLITTETELIYPAHIFAKYMDWFLIIPGATGTLITGIWLSLKKNWGITKYYWIILKLAGNLAVILFGGNFMRFWVDDVMYISANEVNFLHNATYVYSRDMFLYGLIGSLAILIFLLIITIIKPWGKRSKTAI